jgi:hypothetical protein
MDMMKLMMEQMNLNSQAMKLLMEKMPDVDTNIFYNK